MLFFFLLLLLLLFFVVVFLLFYFANFNKCPLVIVYVETVKGFSLSTSSMSFIILKTSTRSALPVYTQEMGVRDV